MTEDAEEVLKAQAAVEAAKAQFGSDDVRVSYKLDELSAALKVKGRLLEAANAAARARNMRSANFARESQDQEQRFGTISDNKRMSAVAWLKKLRRLALVGSAVLFLIVVVLPARSLSASITKGLVGPALAAIFLQLLLYPLQSLPRFVKWVIVIVGSGIVAMALFK